MKHPQRIVIIHGAGGTLLDAVASLQSLFTVHAGWRNGKFLLDPDEAAFLRRLLRNPAENPLTAAAQQRVAARLLECSVGGIAPPPTPAGRTLAEYSEDMLMKNYPHFGVPLSPTARHDCALRLAKDADKALKPIHDAVDRIRTHVQDEAKGKLPTEPETRDLILQGGAAEGDQILGMLEDLRDMQEGGGDLDTVTSAVFYTHWVLTQAREEGAEADYGIDYRYAFVNYHQGMRQFAQSGPAELLMADFPSGAIPDLEGDVRFLREHDVRLSRFEDHHPYSFETLEAFTRLKDERLIDYFALSGPKPDEDELAEEELKCGADMVFESCVQDTPGDVPGARRLRDTAHSEDFVAERTDLGRALTQLIKGGCNKVELVQLMVASIPGDDLEERLRNRGWLAKAEEQSEQVRESRESLLEHAYVLKLKRPETAVATEGGESLGDGSDMPAPPSRRTFEDDKLRILMALAPPAEKGKPRINVGHASGYFRERFPDVDYLFYCYGASILAARRLNQADLGLNLAEIMPRIGGPGDGGHSGAAVARPEANAAYPTGILGRVNQGNFRRFVSYMRYRLDQEGHSVVGLENRSKPAPRSGDTRKILYVLGGMVAVGLVLVLVSKAFRPNAVRESNADFFPHVPIEASAAPDTTGPEPEEGGDQ